MGRVERLSDPDLAQRLHELPGWRIQAGKLYREFRFRNFAEAFAFMTQSALIAESMNHHPEWFNVWNRVVVELVTHDADGITELDLRLAARMSEIVDRGDSPDEEEETRG